ncbi:MAG: DUF349 domain-containing protein [Acidobacteria bacterium]|nr:DUF349 domain-containing protein [Acidobacteriota bacterium]
MAFLDRFKPQPRWKHSDAGVREAAVEELDPQDRDLLQSIAREDGDARVRRAAVRKLDDPETLAEVARVDSDEYVRGEASRLLIELASRDRGEASDAAVTALAHMGDQKALVSIAKAGQLESARRCAVAAISDQKALGSIARHATSGSIRLESLSRVHDPAELVAVAIKTEHRDVALAALDRIADQDALKTIANRARQKAAARRARALLEATGQVVPAATAVEAGDPQEQARRLCGAAESLAASADAEDRAERLRLLQADWAEVEQPHPDLVRRFNDAVSRVQARIVSSEQARIERDRRAEALARDRAARIILCEQIEAIGPEDLSERLEELDRAWDQLGPIPAAQDARLASRFAEARDNAVGRREHARAEAAARSRLIELADTADRLAEAPIDAELRKHWGALVLEWEDVSRRLSDPDLQARLEAARRRLAERDDHERTEQARRQRDNLVRLQHLCERVEQRSEAENLTLKEADRMMRDLKSALDDPGSLPATPDREPVGERLKAVRGKLGARLRELREADDWQRWANAAIQEQLCVRTEALLQVEDLDEAAKALRQIQSEWRAASAVPRSRAQALWRRFKAAHDQLWPRLEAHFAQQAGERAENLRRKEALCASAEALTESTDWIHTADEMKRLQAEWQTIGPVPRQHAKGIWKRFRGSCDRFFTRRQEDLAKRKEEWAHNLARKEALCARVEDLAATTDWDAAAAEVRRLQAEWRTVGPVRKKKSEAIWQRFRAACDQFFERHARRDELQLSATISDREAILSDLEALVPPQDAPMPPAPADLAARVRSVRERWVKLPPLPRDRGEPLERRFTTAVQAIATTYREAFRGTDLDFEANRRKMEQLCVLVEGHIKATGPVPDPNASPVAILAVQLREALAANTIGGRIDQDAKWRNAAEDVKRAQVAWKRIGPVPPEVGRALASRFERACARFFEHRRAAAGHRPVPSSSAR